MNIVLLLLLSAMSVVAQLQSPTNVVAGPKTFSSVFIPASPVPKGLSVTLVWDPSLDVSVTGYKVYYGAASKVYPNSITLGNTTNVTIKGLLGGRAYYFAATAFDISGLESDFSNEVLYYTKATLSLAVDRWIVRTSGVFGATNDLMMSTSLGSTNWTTILTFVGTGQSQTVLQTNGISAFYKLVPR